MEYFDSSFATVQYDEQTGAVIGELREFVKGESFREYMDAIIEAIADQSATKVIADTSSFDAALTEDDQVWSVQDWAPRAEDAGLETMALVMPESILAKMSVDKIIEMTEDEITRKVFSDREAAERWIQAQ
ncbi:hypothetical protein [Halovenus salina]|uniref:SpoIIAA-like n=1 Tax=Halovenus salina TaxID=1510225 RepID=A0ABD5W0H4_9EURY|nr:hypothetical protein [Halovenus salina]